MTPLVIGSAIGLMIVVLLVPLGLDLATGEPAAEPSAIVADYELTHEMLFEPRRWARGIAVPAADVPAYNRPLDIDAPADAAILPPPRLIRGINNEA